MKKTITSILLTGALALPTLALAQSYAYVSNVGQIKAVEAPTAGMALAEPSDIAPHSGVIEAAVLVAGNYNSPVIMNGQTVGNVAMTLNPNGTVALNTTYTNGQSNLAEMGTWQLGSNGVAVNITGDTSGTVYSSPRTFSLSQPVPSGTLASGTFTTGTGYTTSTNGATPTNGGVTLTGNATYGTGWTAAAGYDQTVYGNSLMFSR